MALLWQYESVLSSCICTMAAGKGFLLANWPCKKVFSPQKVQDCSLAGKWHVFFHDICNSFPAVFQLFTPATHKLRTSRRKLPFQLILISCCLSAAYLLLTCCFLFDVCVHLHHKWNPQMTHYPKLKSLRIHLNTNTYVGPLVLQIISKSLGKTIQRKCCVLIYIFYYNG